MFLRKFCNMALGIEKELCKCILLRMAIIVVKNYRQGVVKQVIPSFLYIFTRCIIGTFNVIYNS